MIKRTTALVLALSTIATGAYYFAQADEHEEDEEHEGREHPSFRLSASPSASSNLPSTSNPKYKAECSSCHMLYPPGLLPARSWSKVMAGLSKHFGENASIDARLRDELTQFLTANSADNSTSRRGSKINQSISTESTPIRITETSYFIHKHDEIGSGVWRRPKIKSAANCIACHKNAEQGMFSEHEVSIPK